MPTETIFNYITQGCQTLTATTSPAITAMGLHICISLATIMLVWFGIQEALANGFGQGSGFDVRKFFGFFILITFTYAMVNFYDSSIPGLGFSIKGFIDGGTLNLVQLIGADSSNTMIQQITQASGTGGSSVVSAMLNPYNALVTFVVQFLLALLIAVISAIVAYGAIAATIIGIFGPLFIPFLVFQKLDWLFWGWLKAYLAFSFYKVVAAAALSVMSNVLTGLVVQLTNASDPASMVGTLPLLIVLVLVNVYVLIKIPAMTASLFSGSTSGHDGGMGLAMLAISGM